MMKLYSSTASPFARKARVVVLEKALASDVEELFITTNAIDPDPVLMEQNPLGKIPCLVLEDGQAVFDSRVICQYLDVEHGTGQVLHPSGNVRHKTLIALVDGALDAAVLMVYESKLRPKELQFSPFVEGQWLKIENALLYAEREYADILGIFNMGTIGMVCLLEYLDFRMPERDWRQLVPELAKWHEDIKDRASFVETRPYIK